MVVAPSNILTNFGAVCIRVGQSAFFLFLPFSLILQRLLFVPTKRPLVFFNGLASSDVVLAEVGKRVAPSWRSMC